MIAHEKYLSLGSTKTNEIGKNDIHIARRRDRIFTFTPTFMMNQKNDDGDVDMYHK